MRARLPYAFACYAFLGVAATFTLEGHLRWIIWLLLAALAFKSWIAVRRSES